MPFLVLPRSLAVSERSRLRMASRLCPYTGIPQEVLRTPDHSVWATSIAIAESGRLASALATGTARFEVRVEGEALVVTTDPLGTCPIWYARSRDGWMVSPEAKAVAAAMPVVLRPDTVLATPGPRSADWSPFENVNRLPPGCSLRLTRERAVPEGRPVVFECAGGDESVESDWAGSLGAELVSSSTPSCEPTGAFVSGGIDSAIACSLARRHGPVSSFSLGTAYGDEFPEAARLAEALGCAHREVRLDLSQVREELDRAVFQNEIFDGLTAEIVLQFSILYGAAAPACRRVTTGYGSDLLFDGMLRHRAYLAAVGLDSTPELLARTRWTGELSPFVAWSRRIAVEHAFWKPSLIALALRVPRELCYVEGVEKHVLRRAAVAAGLLSEDLAFRKKTGMSEGTGANRLLSAALGIDDPFAYPAKSSAAVARLRSVFGDAR